MFSAFDTFIYIAVIVTIESAAFNNVFLRLDGNGVTSFNGAGVGTVNCQFGAGPYEKFIVSEHDGNYAFESLQFPNVFLRMDGSQVTEFKDAGAGTVNGQFGFGAYEAFKLKLNPDGLFSIQSVQFPQAFLRIDGRQVTSFNGAGSGVVNAQFGDGPWEKFIFHVL